MRNVACKVWGFSELTILNMGVSCVYYNYDDRLGRILQIRVNFACYYRMPMGGMYSTADLHWPTFKVILPTC